REGEQAGPGHGPGRTLVGGHLCLLGQCAHENAFARDDDESRRWEASAWLPRVWPPSLPEGQAYRDCPGLGAENGGGISHGFRLFEPMAMRPSQTVSPPRQHDLFPHTESMWSVIRHALAHPCASAKCMRRHLAKLPDMSDAPASSLYAAPVAPELVWSDALSLSMPAMDATHVEFVDLLAQVQQASDADVLQLWAELVAHTEDHFGQEDR